MTASERAARTAEADALCVTAYEGAGGPASGAALVAVGGYGRGELAPYSDLDVVLVSDEGVDLGDLPEKVWYPLWDSGSRLDHSVRTMPEMLTAAAADLRVASGLLDVRHLAGDPHLTLRLRTTMLAEWRRGARERLPALHDLVRARHDLLGELAHLSVPDVKEAEGGLRDATVLRGLVATWLVDVPHVDLERSRRSLLDVRDLLHATTGRATDRIAPEVWPDLAEALDLADDLAAQVHVRDLGRRIAHLSRLAWRRVDAVLARPVSVKGARRPSLEPVAAGVALSAGEIVLDRKARPAEDPVLLLRAATAAAERDVVLAPATAARLVRECPPLPDPWPDEARQLLVRLLASGRSLLAVWETLEETQALSGFLPEWERVRSLPHASVIHRFTVDRHVIETCIEASSLIRSVARPDVLMVAALLHDIGKGGLTEHSVAGEPIARGIAIRMGFAPDCVELISLLVRWHLLLAQSATTRDPDDPATVELVTSRLGSVEAVALLGALTEADAKATSPKAWSSWRAGLILDLARRAHAALDTGAALPPIHSDEVPVPADLRPDSVYISVEPVPGGSRVTTIAIDRVGLLADFAAMFALQRTAVRAARVWAQGEHGISVWEVADEDLDQAILRQKYDAIVDGRLDPSARLRPGGGGALAPTVVVRPEASDHATVLEVRTADRPGVVYLVCATLARLDVEVRSAHVDTLGPQAVDVFYVVEPSAGALSETRAAAAAYAVREALTGPG
ncbi:[protein-PII] uridylyltransferase [Nocardioides sp. cx-169]|uniref:[protein-PII] uridylyltransferase n=1 Tax=Nocardioides sp. cx-169 TaxID=2899080 RepID=UPI001E584AE2|nr:[protein-PII] uridylyltransferase [Nocardioides sp. cx-169]MCD4536005.1 [protein-PII] uridylyltransferase [Nocardioides sp. cx-169]